MNTINKLALASALLLAAAATPLVAQDATNAPPSTGDTGTILGRIAWTSKDWVLIPYVAYDVSSHKVGVGGALLYMASTNLWTGIRAQSIDGQSTTAGVQAQLQASIKLFGVVTVTPFLQTSVGLGNNSVYAEAGPGMLANIYSHTWSNGKSINIGLVGDYEHVVNGSLSYNQVNAGPLFNLSF